MPELLERIRQYASDECGKNNTHDFATDASRTNFVRRFCVRVARLQPSRAVAYPLHERLVHTCYFRVIFMDGSSSGARPLLSVGLIQGCFLRLRKSRVLGRPPPSPELQ